MSQHSLKYVSKSRKTNFDTWEYHYFRHLLEMYDLFEKRSGTKNDDPKVFRKFTEMIYRASSKNMTRNVEHHTKKIDSIYTDYISQINNE